MAIKIRQNGIVKDLVINASEVAVLDVDGNFKSKNLETILKQIATTGTGGSGTGGSGYPSDAEFVYVKDTEPDMDGVWLDESDVTSDDSSVGSNSVVKEIKSYVNSETSKINASLTNAKAELEEKDAELLNKIGILNNGVNQISNPNLLINGDFQVWQRGLGNNGNNYFNCVNANVYTADRFMVCGEQGTSLIAQKEIGTGMRVVFQDHTLNTSNIRTWFDRDDILKMVGKTYTYSVEYQYEYNDPWGNGFNMFSYPNNSVKASFIKSKKIEVGFKQIRLEVTFRIDSVGDDTTKMHIQWLRSRGDVDGFGYHIIRYVKLEEGSIATPFVPRHYAEELALCQRYYQRLNTKRTPFASFGIALGMGNTSNRLLLSLPVQMRTIPTVSIVGNVRVNNGNIYLSKAKSVSVDQWGGINGKLILNTEQSIPNGLYECSGDNDINADLILDAEIY